jgi:hypothetical protein
MGKSHSKKTDKTTSQKTQNQTPEDYQQAFEELEKRQKTEDKQTAANKYDKIIKENAPESIGKVIEVATELRMVSWEDYPHEVQYTLERRPDFLKKVVEEDGTPAIWHGEYQVPDDKKMIFRFLVYCGLFKRNEGHILVRQFVIYLGQELPQMLTEIKDPDLFFRFHLIPLIKLPYHKFLESGKPQEALVALLCDFQGETPEKVLELVVQAIVKNADTDLDKQKHLQQLQVIGQLRNFEQIIEKIMESESLKEYVSIEKTYFYKKGVAAGAAGTAEAIASTEAKYEKLLITEESMRREEEHKRKEEEQKRKEEEQKRLILEHEQEQLIATLLLNSTIKKERIVQLAGVRLDAVEKVEAKIDKIQKLLIGQILTVSEIALAIQSTEDFVNTVINSQKDN